MSDETSISLTDIETHGAHPKNGVKGESKKRVTFVLPEPLDQALEIYCSGTGQLKNDVAARALAEYLSHHRQRLQEALEATNSAIGRLFPQPLPRTRRARA